MYIGIDPDLKKSGIAILYPDKELELFTLDFINTLSLIRSNKDKIKCVRIEAGWLNTKSNWHPTTSLNKASKIGKNVGENHATGKLLAECIQSEGIKVLLVKPTASKCNAELFHKLTKYAGKTNQETRDAAMLVYGLY